MPLLEIDNVSKIFSGRSDRFLFFKNDEAVAGGIAALKYVNLSVKKGTAVGIVGESGAGKTTLGGVAAGLVRPTEGSVRIKGLPVDSYADRAERARIVQIIWQDAPGSLDPRMKIGRAVAEPLRIHKLVESSRVRQKVAELMTEVGLKGELADRYPHELSGGEMQRVVIARALALDPELLICDEPASALDVRIKKQIIELLIKLRQKRGITYIIIAHDLMLVRTMTDELVVMLDGSVVEKGRTADILDNPKDAYTRKLIEAEPSFAGL